MTKDEKYMARCLYLAKLGIYSVAPNPMVGAVIVYENEIISEGWHRKFGNAHAEPNAIHSVARQDLLLKSTLYVNLEPCSHFGKTPPCANLIVEKKIKRVVIGCLDPNPNVSGRGVQLLREAGVEVEVGVLEKQSRELNKRFICFQENKRPFVLLKWAQTKDGFIDTLRADHTTPALRISNAVTSQFTHKMRAENMGIMVGTNTVLLDDPSLTVRNWQGRHPVRISFDRNNVIPENSVIKNGEIRTFIFTEKNIERNKNVEYIQQINDFENLSVALQKIAERNIHSVLVEGGATLLQRFIDAGLWDEANVEISNQLLGSGVKSPTIDEKLVVSKSVVEGHLWKHYEREKFGV